MNELLSDDVLQQIALFLHPRFLFSLSLASRRFLEQTVANDEFWEQMVRVRVNNEQARLFASANPSKTWCDIFREQMIYRFSETMKHKAITLIDGHTALMTEGPSFAPVCLTPSLSKSDTTYRFTICVSTDNSEKYNIGYTLLGILTSHVINKHNSGSNESWGLDDRYLGELSYEEEPQHLNIGLADNGYCAMGAIGNGWTTALSKHQCFGMTINLGRKCTLPTHSLATRSDGDGCPRNILCNPVESGATGYMQFFKGKKREPTGPVFYNIYNPQADKKNSYDIYALVNMSNSQLSLKCERID